MYEIYLWLLVLVMSVFLGGVFSVFFKGVGRKLIAGLCFFMAIGSGAKKRLVWW